MSAASPFSPAAKPEHRTQEMLIAAETLAKAAAQDSTISSATLILSNGDTVHLTVAQACAMVAKAAPAGGVQ
jgi:hypothetical protein